MDAHEDLAILAEAASSNLRGAFVREYRQLIGVDAQRRALLRECLRRLDGATVADVIDRVND